MVATLMVVTTAIDCEKCENALIIYEQFSKEIGGMFKVAIGNWQFADLLVRLQRRGSRGKTNITSLRLRQLRDAASIDFPDSFKE
jgi:hypothetical protein